MEEARTDTDIYAVVVLPSDLKILELEQWWHAFLIPALEREAEAGGSL